MSLQAITLHPDYRYVIATLASSAVINVYQYVLVGLRRKAAKVPYPNAYATADEAAKDMHKFAFNAAQRAQTNFTEQYPSFVVTLAVAGLEFPRASAALGAAWIVARFVYTWGYTRVGAQYSRNGAGRLIGAWFFIPQFALLGMALYTGLGPLLA